MEQRRLSLSMIEQMNTGSYGSNYFRRGLDFSPMMTMVDDDDDRFEDHSSTTNLSRCQLSQSRGATATSFARDGNGSTIQSRTKPSTIVYSNKETYRYRPQQHRQEIILPTLRSESSKSSMNTSFSSSTASTHTSIGSNSITFYQSPTKDNYFVDHKDETTNNWVDQNATINSRSESKQFQRGVDRSIALPRESHLLVTSNKPVATGSTQSCYKEHLVQPTSSVLTTISPNRNGLERSRSSVISPSCLATVTPEITRPKKTFQRNASSDSILPMPPLYPISSPQRQATTPRPSKASPIQRRMLNKSTTAQAKNDVSAPSASIATTPRSIRTSRSDECYNVVDTRARTVATMCSIPPDIVPSTIIPTADTTELHLNNTSGVTNDTDTSVPVMVDLAPGVKMQLRGAGETQVAINSGFYIQCDCMFCSVSDSSASRGNEIYCILDCDYFICPTCRSVHPNPISTNSNVPTISSSNYGARYPGGLGLGFRLEK